MRARGHDNDNATFKSGGGREHQAQVEYHHALFLLMESVLGQGGEGKGGCCNDNDGTGNNDSRSGRMGTGSIFGRVCLIYKVNGDIAHHKRASTLGAFGNGG